MIRRAASRLHASLPLCVALAAGAAGRAGAQGVQVRAALAHDLSAPLTLLPPADPAPHEEHEPRPFRRPPAAAPPGSSSAGSSAKAASAAAAPGAGPAQPAAAQPLVATSPAVVFPGIGDGFSSPTGVFSITAHPPDTVGDIGPGHYVQIVNDSLAVFDRTGAVLYGAVPTNTLWSGFDAHCAQRNDGDGVVLYDPLADRWLITQFSVPVSGPWYQCVAVSQGPDPTGQYYRYLFPYDGFNDYGKFGVWPDAYYATYNVFADGNKASSYRGAQVCALDRASLLSGTLATQQCFKLYQADAATPPNPLYGGLLPADLDGPLPPPAGAPNPLLSFDGGGNLQLWKFHVDWVDPTRSTINGNQTCTTSASSCAPILVPVSPYTPLCFSTTASTGTCIPQRGVSQQLDSLGDRPMFRLAYRNFGDHESLLLNHSVQAGAGGGVRWYELRDLSAAAGPTLFQQGTWAPDANFRWLGSLAMDAGGNVALAYSLSGPQLYPSILYTARAAGDAAGAMTLAETSLQAGSGTQGATSFAGANRWGDYSSMSIDPLDDCTFWFTSEYMPATGNWRTAVASFRVPSCATLRIAAPATGTVVRGGSVALGVSVSSGNSTTGTVALSIAGLPTGVTAAFNPALVALPGKSILTVAADTSSMQTLRAVPLRVVAALQGTTQVRSAPLALDVLGNEFALSAGPQLSFLFPGAMRSIAVQTQAVNGAAESIAFSTGPLPPGVAASFAPAVAIAGGGSTLTLTGGAALADQKLKLVVQAAAASSSHNVFLDLETLVLPTPSLLSPASGARLVGLADFSVVSQVSPSTTLSKLELLADGQAVGQIATPGFIHLDTTQVPNGSRQFSVRATDAAGGVGLSAPVTMTVDNPKGCGCSGARGAPDAAALALLPLLLWLRPRRRQARSSAAPQWKPAPRPTKQMS